MNVKLFELRDRGTFIPVFAFRCQPTLFAGRVQPGCDTAAPTPDGRERFLLSRAGYGPAGDSIFVILGRLECSETARSCTYDPFAWGPNDRTFHVAHEYVTNHWDELQSGDVLDVEFILGETTTKKVTEQLAGDFSHD